MRTNFRGVFLFAALALLSGCGPSLSDANKAGFNSLEEMAALNKQGYKTKSEFEAAEAKRLGFENPAEYRDAVAHGFADSKQYRLKKIYGFSQASDFSKYKYATEEERFKILGRNAANFFDRAYVTQCVIDQFAFMSLQERGAIPNPERLQAEMRVMAGTYIAVLLAYDETYSLTKLINDFKDKVKDLADQDENNNNAISKLMKELEGCQEKIVKKFYNKVALDKEFGVADVASGAASANSAPVDARPNDPTSADVESQTPSVPHGGSDAGVLTSESPMEVASNFEKFINTNLKAQQVALKIMDANSVGICMALSGLIVVNEIKFNKKFTKGIVYGVGAAVGAGSYFRKRLISTGTPEVYFSNAITMYGNESIADQNAFFVKYANYCIQKGDEFSSLMTGSATSPPVVAPPTIDQKTRLGQGVVAESEAGVEKTAQLRPDVGGVSPAHDATISPARTPVATTNDPHEEDRAVVAAASAYDKNSCESACRPITKFPTVPYAERICMANCIRETHGVTSNWTPHVP